MSMFWENLAKVAEDASIEWDDIVAVKDDYRLNLYQHAGMRMAEWVYANQSLLLEALAADGVLEVEQSTDAPAFETIHGTIYPARSWFGEFERFNGPSIRYVSPWKEAK